MACFAVFAAETQTFHAEGKVIPSFRGKIRVNSVAPDIPLFKVRLSG